MQRFRGGLVFKAHRLCVALNSRLESNKEEEETPPTPQSGLQGENMATYTRLSVTLSVGSPLCPYGISYRRVYAPTVFLTVGWPHTSGFPLPYP